MFKVLLITTLLFGLQAQANFVCRADWDKESGYTVYKRQAQCESACGAACYDIVANQKHRTKVVDSPEGPDFVEDATKVQKITDRESAETAREALLNSIKAQCRAATGLLKSICDYEYKGD